MKKMIILHCSAPKTGSTSFQHLLYANIPLLLKAGFYCPPVSRKRRIKDDLRILLAELSPRRRGRDAGIAHVRAVIGAVFAETGAHTLVLSNESMLGTPFAKDTRTFLPRAHDKIKLIAEALSDYDVEVRFFVRDYASFLPSWYVQQVRMGARDAFPDFLAGLDLATMSWVPVVTSLRSIFGPERVEIFDHADLKTDAYGLMCRAFPDVMAALGARGHDLPNKNSSIGIGMINAYRRWNGIAERLGWSAASRDRIHHLGRRYVLLPFERFSRSQRISLDPALAARLSAQFKSDLATIRAGEDADGSKTGG
jgi:hypothetical protein